MVILVFQLQNADQQSQNAPCCSDPLGGGGQLLVQTTDLAQIGVVLAGQSAGQAGFLTGLEHDNCDQHQAGDNLQNGNNDLNDFHDFTSLHG